MRRLPSASDSSPPLTVDLEGTAISAREGEPLACALLAAGETVFSRSVKYHRPRGPYCFSAGCSQCLMRVNGEPNIYTCQVAVKPGMRVERQNAYPTAKVDIFGAIDWLFPRGLDHHSMFAGVPVAEQVMAKVARHLAGLGTLPDAVPPARPPAEDVQVKAAIIGGGAAGLAAARVLSDAGVPFWLGERGTRLGGRRSLKSEPSRSMHLSTQAIGLFHGERGRYVAAVQTSPEGPRLYRVHAEHFLLAHGGHAAVLPFENNDLPGVYSGQAARRLLEQHQLVVGENVALVGHGEDLWALARLLPGAKAHVACIVDTRGAPPQGAPPGAVHGRVLKAQGHTRGAVHGVVLEVGGAPRKIACDAIVVCLPPSPAFELARQGGAKVAWSDDKEVFVVEADEAGRTLAPEVWVAGSLLGLDAEAESAASGERAARAMVEALR